MNRRSFIKKVSILGLGTVLMPNITLSNSLYLPSNSKIKIGLIGVGLRGRSSLSLLLNRDDVIIHSICDIDQNAIDESKKLFKKYDKKTPKVFKENEFSYRELLKQKKIDAVIISTPTIAVEKMSKIVVMAPICEPIFIKR